MNKIYIFTEAKLSIIVPATLGEEKHKEGKNIISRTSTCKTTPPPSFLPYQKATYPYCSSTYYTTPSISTTVLYENTCSTTTKTVGETTYLPT